MTASSKQLPGKRGLFALLHTHTSIFLFHLFDACLSVWKLAKFINSVTVIVQNGILQEKAAWWGMKSVALEPETRM